MSPADQHRQRVTVVSPFGQHDVDILVDVPASGLLPDLLAMAGLHPSQVRVGSEGWRLEDAHGNAVPPGKTLAQYGIAPGDVIQLCGLQHPEPAEPATAAALAGEFRADGAERDWAGLAGVGQAASREPATERAANFWLGSGGHDPAGTAAGVSAAEPDPVSHDEPVPQPEPVEPVLQPEPEPLHPPEPVLEAEPLLEAAPAPGADPVSEPEPVPEVPEAAPAAAAGADGLTPLQRTEAALPSRVGQLRRGSAAVAAFFAGPGAPAAAAGAPGGGPAPGRPEPQAEQLRSAGPAGRHRLLPADLTVAAPPTRAECARDRWRELDHLGQLDSLITEPRLRHCATIAVVSPKGGVGKTTVTALLGTLFSLLRRDPTVAVDTNPDFGSLGRVLTPDQSWYVDDLARLVTEDDDLSLTALDSQLGRAIHGLLVVPAPTDPARMASLDQDAYSRVITRLKDFFSLILLDCGTGLQDPASAAAVAAADQVVLLTDAQPATASLVAQSAELLQQSGRPITVVVNRMPARGARLDLDQLSRFLPNARGLVVIPDQVPAATRLAGGNFDWRDAPAGWQLAVRQLAVVLVADWRRLGLAQ